MSKRKKKLQDDSAVKLYIPEEEIWTFQVEGLAPPMINKKQSNSTVKKIIFTFTIIVAVSLSMFFSIYMLVNKNNFSYEEIEGGFELVKFTNTGYITEIDIDYVSIIEYDRTNPDPETNFKVIKDETAKVKSIGAYALNCEGMVELISIGKDVEYIDPKAFYSCWALQRIEVDENNPNYCDIEGVLYNKDKTEIICRPCDHDTYLSDKYGFSRYDENGMRIEPSADDIYFKQLYYYEKFVSEDADDKSVEKYFSDKNNLEALEKYFGNEKNSEKYNEEFFVPYYERYTDDVLTYVIPSSVETVGQLCFNYANMKTVYIPEGVKTIETLGFFEIPLLKNIYTYKSDTVTDTHFGGEGTLGEVYISLPEGLEYIGSDAFSYNREIEYMYIPESVEFIGHHAFWDTVYKENDELRGVTVINVAASQEEFENTVETGNSWRPQYDYLLFKKSIGVNYSAQRAES